MANTALERLDPLPLYEYLNRCKRRDSPVYQEKNSSWFSPSVSHHHYHHGYYPYPWWYYDSPPYRTSSPSGQKKKDDMAAMALLGGIAALLSGAYFLGSSLPKGVVAMKNYYETCSIVALCEKNPSSLVLRALGYFAKNQQVIDQTELSKRGKSLVATVITLTAGSSLIIGGLTSSSALITMGTIGIVSALALALFTHTYHQDDAGYLQRFKARCNRWNVPVRCLIFVGTVFGNININP